MLYRFFLLFTILYSGYLGAEELDYIFADFRLDNRQTELEVDLATWDYQNFFLNLDTLNNLFAVELLFEQQSRQLTGTFWETPVKLSLKQSELRQEDGELFVHLNLLTAFEIQYRFDTQRQILYVLTGGRHPTTREFDIQQKKRVLKVLNARKEATLTVNNPYQLGTLPAVDLAAAIRSEQGRINNSLFVQTVSDILFHQADVQINWQQRQDLIGRSLFSRKFDFQSVPMKYDIGDIQNFGRNLVSVPSRGVGFALQPQRGLGRRTNITVNGFTEPFSEVELFRDKLLVDFQQLGEQGFYQFLDVDLRDPSAVYTIRVTTPSGEQQERSIEPSASNGLLTGQWSPNLLYLDGGQSLFNGRSTNDLGTLLSAKLDYALSQSQLLGFGIERLSREDDSSHTLLSSLDWRHSDVLTSAVMLGFNQQILYDAQINYSGNRHGMSFSINKALNNHQFNERQNVSYRYNLGNFFTLTGIDRVEFGDDVNTTWTGDLGVVEETWSLSLQTARTSGPQRRNDIALIGSMSRGHANWNFGYRQSRGTVLRTSLDMVYSVLHNGLNTAISFEWDIERAQHRIQFRLSKNYKRFKLNSNVGYNNHLGWSFGLSISTAFHSGAPDSTLSSNSIRSGSVVSATPFLDKNANNHWDAGEPLLEEVSLKAKNRNYKKTVSSHGITFYGVDVHDPKLFSVDDSALDNPFLVPQYREVRLESHPGGRIAVSIPFHETFEIEGQVMVKDTSGEEEQSVGRVSLVLQKLEGDTAQTVTEFGTESDGFYLLDGLKPGLYRVKVDGTYLEAKGLTCEACSHELDTSQSEDNILFPSPIVLRKRS